MNADSDCKTARTLPRYVVDRDEHARRFGLHAESEIQTDSDGESYIETLWSGPESAFRETGLLSAKTTFVREIRVWRPWINGRLGRLTDASLRLTARDEYPRTIEPIGKIERYDLGPDFGNAKRIAHYGEEDALRDAGVIQFPRKPWIKNGRHGSLSDRREWSATRFPNGNVFHMESVRKTSDQMTAGMLDTRRDFSSPAEFLEDIEDWLVRYVRSILTGKAFTTVVTKHGCRYSLDKATAADIVDAIELVAQRVRDIPVKIEKVVSEEEKAAARKQAADASLDAAFQRFLGQLPKGGLPQ